MESEEEWGRTRTLQYKGRWCALWGHEMEEGIPAVIVRIGTDGWTNSPWGAKWNRELWCLDCVKECSRIHYGSDLIRGFKVLTASDAAYWSYPRVDWCVGGCGRALVWRKSLGQQRPWCGESCRRKSLRRAGERKAWCDWCGEEFTPKRSDAHYCSDAHRVGAWREKERCYG